jgi:hypothetical protein
MLTPPAPGNMPLQLVIRAAAFASRSLSANLAHYHEALLHIIASCKVTLNKLLPRHARVVLMIVSAAPLMPNRFEVNRVRRKQLLLFL